MLKKILLITLLSVINISAHGVAIVNSQNGGVYLKLKKSEVFVTCENQVAITTTRQTFKSDLLLETNFKYAFPIPNNASAINLKYYINGNWYQTEIVPEPQDTTLPGGGGNEDPDLIEYLGETPLYFEIEDLIQPDSITIFELQYVELLPYDFGKVQYSYPGDYTLISTAPADNFSFKFNLISERTIEEIYLKNIENYQLENTGNFASVEYIAINAGLTINLNLEYSLNLNELGLFGFSTTLNDTLVPDEYGSGYFTFVAEPDPSETSATIDKVFTFIIDRSGSMGYSKMEDAKSAANFIVENLNEGDKFNIVAFSSTVSGVFPQHVEYTPENKLIALNYINSISSGGGTNISGAFQYAIPQFSAANDSTANIIVFFTDGKPTAGITDPVEILNNVNNLVNLNETTLSIFSFGVGADVNKSLLSNLSLNNNGFAIFFENDVLEEVISQFYLKIRNPVLLSTEIEFSPNVVQEVYPTSLPNLYKGQQMIISGRYTEGVDVNVKLTGNAFGNPVEYNYTLPLVDTTVNEYQFLTKVWAKVKIEELILLYYSYPEGSPEANAVKQQIIELSIQYGVITEFTSFQQGGVTGIDEEFSETTEDIMVSSYKLIGNFPNPFNPSTIIRFQVPEGVYEMAIIRIYNTLGELVKVLAIDVNGEGVYEISWNGTDVSGNNVVSGTYIYTIQFKNAVLAGKMMLMK